MTIYPLIYDGFELIKLGRKEYFKDPWNFIDQGFIWIGLANCFVQRMSPDITQPQNKILMMSQLIMVITRTFFFFRIFESLSFLVSMMKAVILDLRPFIFVYGFLLCCFGMALGIVDWANFDFDDDPDVRKIQQTAGGPDKEYL
jgi:hypothetical protein